MIIRYLILSLMLSACANSSTEVEHTVDIKGSSDATPVSGNSPSTLKVKMKELWVGEASDCSDLQIVRRLATSGVQTEIYANENQSVISARPINISLIQCVAVKMTDNIAFSPNTDAANALADCSLGTEYTYDIFQAGSNYEPDISDDADLNNDLTTGDANEQDIYLYFSISNPAFTTDPSQVTTMTSALNVDSPYDIILYANYDNQVSQSGGNCVLTGFNLALGVE